MGRLLKWARIFLTVIIIVLKGIIIMTFMAGAFFGIYMVYRGYIIGAAFTAAAIVCIFCVAES